MRFLGAIFTMGVHGAFLGLILAATMFWWYSRELPSPAELAEYKHATLSRVHSADGVVLAEFSRERRVFTPIEEVPPLVIFAFVSAEDKFFFQHEGVDGLALVKAVVDNVNRYMRGARLRGASTITQQVVKNFILSGERALSRKIKEAALAYRFEAALVTRAAEPGAFEAGLVECVQIGQTPAQVPKIKAKCKILELYLNEIFLGSGSYGVGSAALRYFGKRLEELTPAEAAYLAALPKAPSTLHPVRRKERATARRNYVLKEMYENGYLDKQQYDDAIAAPLITLLDQPGTPTTVSAKRPDLGFFSEEIRRLLIQQFTNEDVNGEDVVYGGGLSIRATMDPRLQDLARRVLQQRLWEYSRDRGYSGPIALLPFGPQPEGEEDKQLDPADEDGWRKALGALEIPRDVAPWRPAVVLAVTNDGARIGIEEISGQNDGLIADLPFSDVAEWAAPREGVDENGDAILGTPPAAPSDVWTVGDVIYVAPALNEAGEQIGWSMRQIPELNGALVAMDPHTGRVLAMQGGFSFEASEFNRATQAERQPGSAFKPFVYAAALEHKNPNGTQAYLPNSIVLDGPITITQNDGSKWRPKNYSGRFYGPVPFRWGIEKSHNAMTVRIAEYVGMETIAGYAVRFGVYSEMPPFYSYALGAGETSLLKLTASYAMFVNGGKKIEPTFIDRIQDRFGHTIYKHDDRICLDCQIQTYAGGEEPYVPDEGEQVMDPVTAFQVVSMMEGVTVRGTASKVGKALSFPTAGKTGTTNDGRDAWFVGFTPDLVVGCFIGYDQPRPLGTKMSGGRLCAPVFIEFMSGASEIGGVGADGGAFRVPSEVVLVRIERESGCAVPDGMEGAQYIWEAFRAEDAPYVGDCPEGGIGSGGDDDGPGLGGPIYRSEETPSAGSPVSDQVEASTPGAAPIEAGADGRQRPGRPAPPAESGTLEDIGSGVF